MKFARHLKAEGLTYSTVYIRMTPVKGIYSFARMPIIWKNVEKLYPEKKPAQDEKPEPDVIKKVYTAAKTRMRCFIAFMYSTGARVAAIYWLDAQQIPHYLQMRDLVPLDKYGIYKITIYRGANEQYVTYCSPQTRRDLDNYFAMRKAAGEEFTPETPVFRNDFDAGKKESVHNVIPMTDKAASSAMGDLLLETGVRQRLEGLSDDIKSSSHRMRYSFKQDHGFRKAFETVLIDAGMRELWIDALEGHAIKGEESGSKLRKSYYRPKDDGPILLGTMRPDGIKNLGYVDCMHLLDIDSNVRLKNELEALTHENKELAEKAAKVDSLQAQVTDIMAVLKDLQQQNKEKPATG